MVTTRSPFSGVRPTDESHRVTTLELIFDLVFVFAFTQVTQVTQLMADDPTAAGALRGLSCWRCCGGPGARTRGWATRPAPTRGWCA